MSPQGAHDTAASLARIKVLAPEKGDARWWFGGLAVVKVDGRQSEGRFSMIEMRYPGGLEVPVHVHTREDEVFQVLGGRISCRIGNSRFDAGPGHTIFAPKNIPHGLTVVSDEPAHYLIVYAPSGYEGFIRETSQPAPSLTLPPPAPRPDASAMEKIGEIMSARYGCHFVG